MIDLPAGGIDDAIAHLFAALRADRDVEPLDEVTLARVVARARRGQGQAREMIYEQYVDRVYRTARAMLRCDADAEDVTQDALFTVLTSLHSYRPQAGVRFGAWVMTIAVNTVRRRFRRRRPSLTDTGDLPDIADDTSDPADELDRTRQKRALLQAVAELPDRERAIVSLRYGAELNASDISAALGLEAAAVRKILERARARLGERIDEILGTAGGV